MILLKKNKAQITHLYTQIYNHETYYQASRMDKPSLRQARHSSLGHLIDEQRELAVSFLVLLIEKPQLRQSYVLKRRRDLVQALLNKMPDQVSLNGWSLHRKIWSYILIRLYQLRWLQQSIDFGLSTQDKVLY